MACRVRSLVEVPDSNSVFLWFSTSFASRSSSARLERALRGFLRDVNFCSLSLSFSLSTSPHPQMAELRERTVPTLCESWLCGVGMLVGDLVVWFVANFFFVLRDKRRVTATNPSPGHNHAGAIIARKETTVWRVQFRPTCGFLMMQNPLLDGSRAWHGVMSSAQRPAEPKHQSCEYVWFVDRIR